MRIAFPWWYEVPAIVFLGCEKVVGSTQLGSFCRHIYQGFWLREVMRCTPQINGQSDESSSFFIFIASSVFTQICRKKYNIKISAISYASFKIYKYFISTRCNYISLIIRANYLTLCILLIRAEDCIKILYCVNCKLTVLALIWTFLCSRCLVIGHGFF